MEGKEVRFGIANSALFATVTTDASCGAINGWHDSFTPLGGLVPLANIMLSEVIFGGVGAGHVRHAHLHHPGGVHRRPDGRPHAGVSRQEDRSLRREDGDAGRAGLPAGHSGASRRFRRVAGLRHVEHLQSRAARPLARFCTPSRPAAGNNGSAFGGLSANTLWYNTTIGLTMLVGRFFMIIPMLAIAGNLAAEEIRSAVTGHVPGDDAAVHDSCWSA